MAFNESDSPMTNSVDYDAERAAIAAEHAELAKQRAALNGNGFVPPSPVELLLQNDVPPPLVEALGQSGTTDVPKPAPWLHDTKTLEDGHVLEYRAPDSSAMIALSLVGMDGFDATQQSLIFNKFMSKHLSTSSLAYVLGRMMDPDDAFGLGELISTLTKDDDKG